MKTFYGGSLAPALNQEPAVRAHRPFIFLGFVMSCVFPFSRVATYDLPQTCRLRFA